MRQIYAHKAERYESPVQNCLFDEAEVLAKKSGEDDEVYQKLSEWILFPICIIQIVLHEAITIQL